MGAMRRAWGWTTKKLRNMRELFSGEDLEDAQEHRGDYHEFKANPGSGGAGGLFGGGGGGGG